MLWVMRVRRVLVGRNRVDLQFDPLDARDMQPIDVEAAGMAMFGREVERGFDLFEL